MRTVDDILTENREAIDRATADARAIVARALEDAKRYRVGSPEALAECRERREMNIGHAQTVTDAIDRHQEIADRLVNGAASDGYDWIDEEGDTDGN